MWCTSILSKATTISLWQYTQNRTAQCQYRSTHSTAQHIVTVTVHSVPHSTLSLSQYARYRTAQCNCTSKFNTALHIIIVPEDLVTQITHISTLTNAEYDVTLKKHSESHSIMLLYQYTRYRTAQYHCTNTLSNAQNNVTVPVHSAPHSTLSL